MATGGGEDASNLLAMDVDVEEGEKSDSLQEVGRDDGFYFSCMINLNAAIRCVAVVCECIARYSEFDCLDR